MPMVFPGRGRKPGIVETHPRAALHVAIEALMAATPDRVWTLVELYATMRRQNPAWTRLKVYHAVHAMHKRPQRWRLLRVARDQYTYRPPPMEEPETPDAPVMPRTKQRPVRVVDLRRTPQEWQALLTAGRENRAVIETLSYRADVLLARGAEMGGGAA